MIMWGYITVNSLLTLIKEILVGKISESASKTLRDITIIVAVALGVPSLLFFAYTLVRMWLRKRASGKAQYVQCTPDA
jgi:hypothetical protein